GGFGAFRSDRGSRALAVAPGPRRRGRVHPGGRAGCRRATPTAEGVLGLGGGVDLRPRRGADRARADPRGPPATAGSAHVLTQAGRPRTKSAPSYQCPRRWAARALWFRSPEGRWRWGATEAATTLRSTPGSPRRAPVARAWTKRLPIAVHSAGPATTGRPTASAVSRHSRPLRDPPPTTCTTSTPVPLSSAALWTASR